MNKLAQPQLGQLCRVEVVRLSPADTLHPRTAPRITAAKIYVSIVVLHSNLLSHSAEPQECDEGDVIVGTDTFVVLGVNMSGTYHKPTICKPDMMKAFALMITTWSSKSGSAKQWT